MKISKKILASLVCALLSVVSAKTSFAQEEEVNYCQGGRFKPCVCSEDVSPLVSYRPTLRACRGNAAIITRGKYLDLFSVVVRDKENRDRWPRSGFGGCGLRLATSQFPPNRCSAFKSQRNFIQETENGKERVFCLGAKGTSKLFANVTRITAKLADVPGSNQDPLVRWCLKSPTEPLN